MNIKALVMISLLICLSGCQFTSIKNPDCEIDEAHMNKEIRTGLINEWNSYKKSDGVFIFVLSKNKMPITFPANLNLKIFVLDPDNHTWKQYDNQTIILGEEEHEILDNENDSAMRSISLDLPNSRETIQVFYCVSGIAIDGTTVGASGSYKLIP